MKYKDIRTTCSGESLSETLVASLIISLALIMLLSVTQVGTKILKGNSAKYDEYYDKLNTYESEEAEYVKTLPSDIDSGSYTFTITRNMN